MLAAISDRKGDVKEVREMTVKELIEKLKEFNENAEIDSITIGKQDDWVLIQAVK